MVGVLIAVNGRVPDGEALSRLWELLTAGDKPGNPPIGTSPRFARRDLNMTCASCSVQKSALRPSLQELLYAVGFGSIHGWWAARR
jgi:hypothetical protein